jgi:hypothetical protein
MHAHEALDTIDRSGRFRSRDFGSFDIALCDAAAVINEEHGKGKRRT